MNPMSIARSRNAWRFMLIPYFRISPIPPSRPVTRHARDPFPYPLGWVAYNLLGFLDSAIFIYLPESETITKQTKELESSRTARNETMVLLSRASLCCIRRRRNYGTWKRFSKMADHPQWVSVAMRYPLSSSISIPGCNSLSS